MDISPDGNMLVVGTHGRHVYIYDLKTMKLIQKRESSLKYQTRTIRCFVDSTGYALSSIEGRVSVEYFDANSSIQEKKYAFKCHRTKEEGVETLYPVNAISFHPKYGTFATGGSDKIVNVWDGFNRKKLVSFSAYPASVSSLSFNVDGSLLAVASSYCFEKGEVENPPKDEIYIRKLNEKQVKPKTL
jgi:cell cycle arrest protein BUB3